MFLVRINLSNSNFGMKCWDEFNGGERKLIHAALNEDFFSPLWYTNTQGQRKTKIRLSVVQKTSEQLDDETGKHAWDVMPFDERFNTLLMNGIGRDAQQEQYSAWDDLALDLRVLLIEHFSTKTRVKIKIVGLDRRPTSRDQLELF